MIHSPSTSLPLTPSLPPQPSLPSHPPSLFRMQSGFQIFSRVFWAERASKYWQISKVLDGLRQEVRRRVSCIFWGSFGTGRCVASFLRQKYTGKRLCAHNSYRCAVIFCVWSSLCVCVCVCVSIETELLLEIKNFK